MASGGTNTGTSLRRIRMNSASRSLYRAGLLAALAVALFTFGCGPKKVTPPPARPAPAPAPATPTVTLQASPTSVNKGESDLELEFYRCYPALHRPRCWRSHCPRLH